VLGARRASSSGAKPAARSPQRAKPPNTAGNARCRVFGVFSDHIANFGRGYFFAANYDALFFKDRTYRRIVDTSELSEARKTDVVRLLKIKTVNIKQQDAKRLLMLLENDKLSSKFDVHQFEWRLAWTRSLDDLLRGD